MARCAVQPRHRPSRHNVEASDPLPQADDANYLADELPQLTHLSLLGGVQGTLFGGRLDLTSNSLQVIDITKASKMLTFDSLDCPALREIRCRDFSFYGNGLMPAPPRAGLQDGWGLGWWHSRYRDDLTEDDLNLPCAFAKVMRSGRSGSLVELPEQCAVIWEVDEHRGQAGLGSSAVWATPTTTVADFLSRVDSGQLYGVAAFPRFPETAV